MKVHYYACRAQCDHHRRMQKDERSVLALLQVRMIDAVVEMNQ